MAADAIDSARDRFVLVDQLRRAERHALLSRLASAFAHVMGTPLHVMAGRAAMIRTGPGGAAELENARRIEEQVEQLAVRIRSMIEHLSLHEEELGWRSTSSILDDVLVLYAPVAAAKGVELVLSTSEVPAGMLDAASALVVLTNLASMAVRTAPAGTRVELRVRAEPSSVHFEIDIPTFEPPSSRIDRLEPPAKAGDLVRAEQLQVLSACHAIANHQGARLELTSERIRFECPSR